MIKWIWCRLWGHRWTYGNVVDLQGRVRAGRWCVECGKCE